ncbi:MAG: peptide deformylase [Hungatella sp.]|jgi:peptide deformylase|nr:peptide deformylase [Hungatella sp.]
MAVRHVRTIGDEILYKKCKPVKEMTPRLLQLVEDMFETMYTNYGVGLAAPQVGILKQIVVIDVDDEDVPDEERNQYVFINPEILERRGSSTAYEGCLSVPGKSGKVTRPDWVKVRAWDEGMNEFVMEAEGMLARAICHECDHLVGELYVDLVEGELKDTSELTEEDME